MIDHSFAAQAGLGAPNATHKDDPHGVQAEGLKDTDAIAHGDCAEGEATEQGEKDFATLRARLALAGYSLPRSGGEEVNGRFQATHRGFIQHLDTLAAAGGIASHVGARG